MNTVSFIIILVFVLLVCIILLGMQPSTPSTFVTARGQDFYLQNKQFRSVGVNRYNLLTHNKPQGARIGCANPFSEEEIDAAFANMQTMGVTTVRFWVFQSFTQGGTDLDRLDYIVKTAEKYNIKLIPVFENHWHDCTEAGVKSIDWYTSGYKNPYGSYNLSLKEYINKIVPRYKDNTTIMAWEIVNEPRDINEEVLYAFAKDMSEHIKSLDENHLVSIGAVGSHTSDATYATVYELPGIGYVDYHDYDQEQNDLPHPFAERVALAQRINKPIIIGESGIRGNVEGRDSLFASKMNSFFDSGGDVYLLWSYGDSYITNDNFNITSQDPVARVIREASKGF